MAAEWKVQITKPQKARMFPLLHNKGCGIGVDPQTKQVVCIKMLQPRPGLKYQNEIRENAHGQVENIKYMMSSNWRDALAFRNAQQRSTLIRILLCDGPKDYDCGFWGIYFLDIHSESDKHAILRPDIAPARPSATFNLQEPSVPSNQISVRMETRSCLESQWATFFAALGLRFEYEPKTFNLLMNHTYTPDFYLPDLRAYVEIKPVRPCIETMQKCITMSCQLQNERVVILGGRPMIPYVATNQFHGDTNRYQHDTDKRYSGMIFEKGRLVHPTAVFLEIDGRIDITGVTEHNSIYNFLWMTPRLVSAYHKIK